MRLARADHSHTSAITDLCETRRPLQRMEPYQRVLPMERPIYDYSSLAARRAQALAKESGRHLQQTARSQFQFWSVRLRTIIVENPRTSLGVALGIGVVLGWLIKRR